MPLTTRRGVRVLASVALAAGIGAASLAPALAAPGPEIPELGTRPASAAVVTPGTGPLSVSVLIPIVSPPVATGLIAAEDLEQYTGPLGTLTRQLDAVAGSSATLGVDPMILASIRALGIAAPETARAWLTRLEALPNEVFTLAYADADLVSAARTNTLDALRPTGFGFALDPADFTPVASPAPTETPAPTPSPSVDPDQAPPFPTTDELLAWTTTLPAIAWPADETAGAADLGPLAAAGYADVVVSSELVDSAGPLVAFDGIDGIVSDAPLSAALREAASALSDADRAAALSVFEAALAAEVAAAPGRGVVLTLARNWSGSMTGIVDALASLRTSPSAQLVPLSDILATTTAAATLPEGTADAEREQVFTSLAEDAAREFTFSSVLVDPAPMLDSRNLARIALYSNGWQPDGTAWNESVDAFHTRSAEILSSVQIERGSDVVLLARNTDFRVAVSNTLPWAVTVRVGLTPQNPILRVEGDEELTVEPAATGSVRIPVEAVANGDLVVQATLHSPTGVPIDSAYVKVTAQAEWEGIGTTAIVVVLVLVFGAGIVRIVIQRRRMRASGDAVDEPAATAAGAGEPRD